MRLTSIRRRRRWRQRPEIFRRRWSVATPVGLHPSYVATDHRRFLTTNPGGTPLIIRGKLFRQPRPALSASRAGRLSGVTRIEYHRLLTPCCSGWRCPVEVAFEGLRRPSTHRLGENLHVLTLPPFRVLVITRRDYGCGQLRIEGKHDRDAPAWRDACESIDIQSIGQCRRVRIQLIFLCIWNVAYVLNP